MTIGGLFGIVDEIDDKKVVLDVDGVYLTFERGAIRDRVASSDATSAVVEEVAVETTEATPESAIEE